jgi:hypothetical protein
MGMKLRSFAGVVIVALLSAVLVAPQSAAAVKSGATCKKPGLESILNGRKFTCIKQGKKFVWNKGVVVKAAPTKVSTPTPTPSAVPTPTPTPTFTPPPRPMNWTELVSKSDGITYWAWKLAQERKATSGTVTTEFIIHIGPKTVMNIQEPEKLLKAVAGFYSNAPQVKVIHVAFFDFEDVEWAVELDKKYSSRPRPTEVARTCLSKTLCNGGNAYIDTNLVGFNYVASSPSNREIAMKNNGETVAHEYFHVIQLLPMYDAISRGIEPVWMPDWIREGTAEWFATTVVSREFSDLTSYQRKWSEVELYRDKFNAESVSTVLSSNTGQSSNGFFAYNVGAKVAEALVVLKGVDSILEFYTLGAKGQSFETAFQNIYGISWAEAKPILAQAISNHYK